MAESYREQMIAASAAATNAFDTLVTKLAAGALALSITFSKEIAPKPARSPGWILSAWLGFSASLLANLVSYLLSYRAIRRRIAKEDGVDGAGQKADTLTSLTEASNWASVVLLIAGVVALIGFAFFNIRPVRR